jgi:hypothetical protein
MKKFADIVSFVLGPLFVLLPLPFVLVLRVTDDISYALQWTVFSYSFILIVAVFVALGVFFKIFSNFDVSKRKERPLLFAFSAVVMFCYFLSLVFLDAPQILYIGFAAIVLGLIAITIINKWIKASIHLAVATSVSIFLAFVYEGFFYLFILLVPFLAWARIRVKEHTLQETIVGSLLGAAITIIVYIVSKIFFLDVIYGHGI